MSQNTVPGIPRVGDRVTFPHTRIDVTVKDGRTIEAVRACDCAIPVTAVAEKGGLTHVWGYCTNPGPRVAMPMFTRLLPSGARFNARMGSTPVVRYVLLAEQPQTAAAA